MISDLLPLLAQGGVDDPTPEELADILWLAQRVLPQGPAPGPTDAPTAPEVAPPDLPGEETGHTPRSTEPSQDAAEVVTDDEALDLHVTGGECDTSGDAPTGTPVQVPAAASLPHALALARALKPLARKVPSRTAFALDEEATVARLVDEDLLIPVLRPEPSRWLGLTLVVDRGPSMSLWEDEVHEFQQEVTRLGAFRHLRRWNLLPAADGTAVELRPHPVSDRPARPPREVLDPAGDQLILVLSDTVGAMWRTGAAHRLLADWARHSQVALAHLLPSSLWNRVGTAAAPTPLHIPRPGLPNARWKVVRPERTSAHPAAGGIPVPVVELDPVPVRAWAEMTAGSGRWTTSAALFLSDTPRGVRGRPTGAPVTVSAEEAIRRFRASSTPLAWRLAGLLSAHSPVTVPLARLVQRALLRDSSRGDLAAVFLGGLLRRADATPADSPLHFEFATEVREALLAAQFREDAEAVQELVRTQLTAYLRPRYGSTRTVRGAAVGAAQERLSVPVEGDPYARASREDVARMGATVSATPGAGESPDTSPTVFLSYAGPDRVWAEWVGWQLERAGYVVELDRKTLRSGGDFVRWMDEALRRASVVVALVSRSYVSSEPRAEAPWRDGVLPLVIEPLTHTGPDLPLPYPGTSLHGLEESDAVAILLQAVGALARPARRPTADGPRPSVAPTPRLPGASGGPRVWNIRRRNPDFVGRDDLLDRVRDILITRRRARIQALHGLGGIGKSQVAVEYAHRFASQYDIIWWVEAEQANQLPVSYAELAERLEIGRPDAGIQPNSQALLQHLSTTERWLIILDGAEDPQALAPWLPEGPGHVLVTSRDPSWQRLVPGVDVDTFSRADSVRLLTSRTPTLTEEQAGALAEDLGDLPLALAQAAGVIETGIPVERYRALLATMTARILGEGKPHGYPASVSATVNIVADRLEEENPAASGLLLLGAYFAPEPIPVAWLTPARDSLTTTSFAPDDLLRTNGALYALARYGAATVTGDRFQIHRLTQAVLRERTSGAQAAALRQGVALLLAAADPGDPHLPENWAQWASLTSHLTGRPDAHSDDDVLREPLFRSVRYLLQSGQADAALAMAGDFRARRVDTFGEDDPDSLTWTDLLVEATAQTGAYTDARRLAEDVFARRRRVLGEDHPDTLTSTDNLAGTLHLLGDHTEAHRLHELTLRRRRTVLGEDHPDTLTSASNLAAALSELGHRSEAHRLAEDVLAHRRRVLGDDHPDTLTSEHGLVSSLSALGDLAQAHGLAEDVLARRRRVLGEDHPDTLASLDVLGHTLSDLGRHAEARAVAEDLLVRRRRVLGDDHPATLSAARHLAVALYSLHSYSDAEPLLQDTLARSRRVLGEAHPSTVNTIRFLASVLTAMGKRFQAQKLLTPLGRRAGSHKRR
ncbi:FxSxx-COOH system tetratricopeptide repeat protein [Streptomyces sp. NPDC046909]|uniref:FxSxx-COOH system tetratricopeptide repeat protein n=1 Tax=Streptomyces sp. NPDC046909 TaxID=3155617 RepID=UPI0033D6749D